MVEFLSEWDRTAELRKNTSDVFTLAHSPPPGLDDKGGRGERVDTVVARPV